MSSGGSRVSIPSSVRRTIQDIKEIAGKHSDEDIYDMLKECSMDPNETAQKLLYLDTFHEVKRKPDRRKENFNGRSSEDFRPMLGTRGRGARGGRGNYSSHNFSHEANGGRNVAGRKENGVNHITGRESLPVSHKTENKETPTGAKSLATATNGPKSVSNGSFSQGRVPQTSVVGLPRDSSAVDANKLGTAPSQSSVDVQQHPNPTPIPTSTSVSGIRGEQGKSTSVSNNHALPAAASGVYSSSSDPVLVPSLNSRLPNAVGAIGREVGTQRVAPESSSIVKAEMNHIQMNKLVSQSVEDSDSISKTAASGTANSVDIIMPNESKEVVVISESPSITVEASSQSLPAINVSVLEEEATKLHQSDVQHVIFPNHFQVPDAYKSGLTFGSFDGCLGLTGKFINGVSGEMTSTTEVDSFQSNDETAREPSLSNQSVSSTAQEVDYPDHTQSPERVPENVSPSEGDDSSIAAPTFDQSNQEALLPTGGGPQFPVVQTAPNYNFGFVPPMLGSQLIQFEGTDPQARLPNFANGNSLALSTSGPTPPATPAGVTPSLPVSPQPLPVFRQAYPPNYLPYSHYYSPFFVPPVHQFLSHGGFPQQPATGNVYLPPVASTGVKYALPQYKPGTNAGNQTHVALPSGYGSFTSTPVAYGLNSAVTSGSSTGNEDLAASHLKENNMYTTGQQTEGSAVWFPTPGRDIAGLQANSFYNLPPQGQHVAFSPAQAGHGTFPGLYHPGHTMTAPSTVHPLMQQSQAMAGPVESVGPPPPSGSYQQHQGAQMNWNGSY